MDSYTVDQLERYSDQLAEAVKSLRASVDASELDLNSPDALPDETAKAKASIFATVEGIRTLLDEPNEFLQRLTLQVRIPQFSDSFPHRTLTRTVLIAG